MTNTQTVVRVDGRAFDMPVAQRGFQRFTSEQRSNRRASFRLGFRQRDEIGTAFWTHPFTPGVCFPTRIAAHRAALRAMAHGAGVRDA